MCLVSIALLTSCEKDLDEVTSQIEEISMAANKTSVDPNELPETIIDYTIDNHFETYINESWEAPALGFELLMANGTTVFFDENNNPLINEKRKGKGRRGGGGHGPCGCGGFGEKVDVTDLPNAITDYVTSNYPDAEIKRAKQTTEGDYIVGVKGTDERIILKFDEGGNFLGVLEPHAGGPCGGNKPPLTEITTDDLPSAVIDYINSNFADAEIKFVGTNDENGDYVIKLFVDDNRTMLVFDSEGNFLFQRP